MFVLPDGDDDFDDFQAAPPSAPISPAPTASAPAKANMNIFDALGSTPQGGFSAQQAAQPQRMSMSMQSGYSASPVMSPVVNRSSFASPVQQQPMSPSVFGGGGLMSPTSPPPSSTAGRSAVPPRSSLASATSAKSSGSGGGFDDLWSMSLGSSGAAKPAANNSGAKKSIKDLEKEKAQASIWGGAGGANSMGTAFRASSNTQASSSGGNDDLLL